MFNKIENLAGLFEDIDDIDELQKEVNSFHQKFQMDSDKLLSQQEAFLDGQDTAIIDLCFKLIQFFDEEKGLYNLHARNNDYATYMSAYAIAFEKIF